MAIRMATPPAQTRRTTRQEQTLGKRLRRGEFSAVRVDEQEARAMAEGFESFTHKRVVLLCYEHGIVPSQQVIEELVAIDGVMPRVDRIDEIRETLPSLHERRKQCP